MIAKKKGAGKKGAVTKRRSTAVSTHVAKKPGRGFEEADASSYAIPFLAVLQKLSPACDSDAPEYVKGAKPGMFINTVTNELFDEVEVIPCAFQRRFHRWAPRDQGGGFKGVFLPADVIKMEAGDTIKMDEDGRYWFPLPDGGINEKKCDTLTDTRMHFCLQVLDDGTTDQVLVSLSRTQLKKSKSWMSNMSRRGGDMFDNVYTVVSKDEENDQGKWKGWVIDFSREAEPEEVAAGETLYESVTAGNVKVKMENDISDD